jgi:Leucine-rich repeat (LRR) protein
MDIVKYLEKIGKEELNEGHVNVLSDDKLYDIDEIKIDKKGFERFGMIFFNKTMVLNLGELFYNQRLIGARTRIPNTILEIENKNNFLMELFLDGSSDLETIKNLENLRNLSRLWLADTSINNINAIELYDNLRLKVLSIANSKIKSLRGVEKFENLNALNISYLNVTNTDLRYISKLKELTNLFISFCGFTKIIDLSTLENLEMLWANGVIFDEILLHKKAVKKIFQFQLNNCSIYDGKELLDKYVSIRRLSLNNNHIVDISWLKKYDKLVDASIQNQEIKLELQISNNKLYCSNPLIDYYGEELLIEELPLDCTLVDGKFYWDKEKVSDKLQKKAEWEEKIYFDYFTGDLYKYVIFTGNLIFTIPSKIREEIIVMK